MDLRDLEPTKHPYLRFFIIWPALIYGIVLLYDANYKNGEIVGEVKGNYIHPQSKFRLAEFRLKNGKTAWGYCEKEFPSQFSLEVLNNGIEVVLLKREQYFLNGYVYECKNV